MKMVIEINVELVTFSPNGRYMLTVVEGEETLHHLSTPWDITSRTHVLSEDEYDDVVKKLLKRSYLDLLS